MGDFIEDIRKLCDKNREVFQGLADFLWENPETGLVEYKSSGRIKEILQNHGFTIEENISGIETSFIARKGKGRPYIGLACEYDALAGLSQERGLAKPCPRDGEEAGHGCGHNLLGSGALGAALVLSQYIEEKGKEGSVVLLGCPSEERDGAKVFMGRDGYFDDLDLALGWHPEAFNGIWDGTSLANTIAVYKFKGRSSHAAASPHLGRSALDGVELMNIGVNYLREHIIPEARVHYAYLDAGGSAPNIVQSSASIYYFIRSPKIEDSVAIYERVNDIARGAALMTGTELEIDLKLSIADFKPNLALSKILYQSILDFGLPEFDQEDFDLAKDHLKTLDEENKKSTREDLGQYFSQEEINQFESQGLVSGLKEFKGKYGKTQMISTDMGDLSHYSPTGQFFLTTAAFSTPLHSWQMTSQVGSSIASKALYSAVGILATCGARIINDPSLLLEIREEFNSNLAGYKTILAKDAKIRDPKIEA